MSSISCESMTLLLFIASSFYLLHVKAIQWKNLGDSNRDLDLNKGRAKLMYRNDINAREPNCTCISKEELGVNSTDDLKIALENVKDLVTEMRQLKERVKELEWRLSPNCTLGNTTSESEMWTSKAPPLGPRVEKNGAKDFTNCISTIPGPRGERGEPGPSLEAPELISVATQTVVVNQTGTIALRCVVRGHPRPKVRWIAPRKAGLTVNESNNTYVVSVFMKRGASLSDQGTYVCEASTILGKITAAYDVIVQVKPQMHLDSETAFAQLGSTVDLPVCKTVATPLPTFRWYRAHSDLPIGRYRLSKNDTMLTIYNSKLEDVGYYFCEAKNILGTAKKSILLSLSVAFKWYLVPPKYVFHPKDEIIKCGVQGFPPPAIKFYRNGVELTRVTIRQDGIGRRMLNVTVNSLGKYTCNATSNGETIITTTIAKNIFSSEILLVHQHLAAKLGNWLMDVVDPSKNWKLCARYNGNNFRDFFSNCGLGPTVILLKVKGNIFGGFSDINWENAKNVDHTASTKAFLFSLKSETFPELEPQKMSIKPLMSQYAISSSYSQESSHSGSSYRRRSSYQRSSSWRRRFTIGFGKGPTLVLAYEAGSINVKVTPQNPGTFHLPESRTAFVELFLGSGQSVTRRPDKIEVFKMTSR